MCYAVNPMYVFKGIPGDIIIICISYIQDSHPITEARQYWKTIIENGYKSKLQSIRPSMLEYLLILNSFDNYIRHNSEVYNNLLYLPESEVLFFENYNNQQAYIDKCLIISSYLTGLNLDYQLKFLFNKLLTLRSFPNFNILTISFLKYMRDHMRHFPFINDNTKLTDIIRNYQFNNIIEPNFRHIENN
tara:strand:- start:263 stop:829 length:567 start_codon:yes stop_codon:yes gene_type:complete